MLNHAYIKTFESTQELIDAIQSENINFWTSDTDISSNPCYDLTIIIDNSTRTLYWGKHVVFEKNPVNIGDNITLLFRKIEKDDLTIFKNLSEEDKSNIIKSSNANTFMHIRHKKNFDFSKLDASKFRSKIEKLLSLS